MDKEYAEAIAVAKERLADLRERGEEAVGDDWEDVRRELFTPEEIAASDARVAIISEFVNARQDAGTYNGSFDVEWMESEESPKFSGVLAELAGLGKTLVVAPLSQEKTAR